MNKHLMPIVVALTSFAPISLAIAQEVAPALTVSISIPSEHRWPETVPASGWLKPWQEAVIASETSGLRITELLVDVGAVVKKGDILAHLFQEGVLADLKKQEAAVEIAKANLTKAKSDADRARQLRPTGAISAEKYVEYIATEQTTTATLASEEAALQSARIKFDQTTITAVDDGLITSRSADLGAVVSAGTELFRMVRQQRVEWQAEVSARYLPRISQGMNTRIKGVAEQPLEGKVRLVAPSINNDSGRAIVYVSLPQDIHRRFGLYVTGTIELEASSALTVPDTALIYRDGMTYLFVVDQGNRVRRVRVETGRRRDGEVEIASGLQESDRIVTAGGTFLSDNDLVKIAEKSQ